VPFLPPPPPGRGPGGGCLFFLPLPLGGGRGEGAFGEQSPPTPVVCHGSVSRTAHRPKRSNGRDARAIRDESPAAALHHQINQPAHRPPPPLHRILVDHSNHPQPVHPMHHTRVAAPQPRISGRCPDRVSTRPDLPGKIFIAPIAPIARQLPCPTSPQPLQRLPNRPIHKPPPRPLQLQMRRIRHIPRQVLKQPDHHRPLHQPVRVHIGRRAPRRRRDRPTPHSRTRQHKMAIDP